VKSITLSNVLTKYGIPLKTLSSVELAVLMMCLLIECSISGWGLNEMLFFAYSFGIILAKFKNMTMHKNIRSRHRIQMHNSHISLASLDARKISLAVSCGLPQEERAPLKHMIINRKSEKLNQANE